VEERSYRLIINKAKNSWISQHSPGEHLLGFNLLISSAVAVSRQTTELNETDVCIVYVCL